MVVIGSNAGKKRYQGNPPTGVGLNSVDIGVSSVTSAGVMECRFSSYEKRRNEDKFIVYRYTIAVVIGLQDRRA